MNFGALKNIHFIGIGGIGMSALARYFKSLGKNVSGYDKTSTSLTKTLEEEGMTIYYEENLDLLPEAIKYNPQAAHNLIVYTPAVPKDHTELKFFQEKNVRLYKRAEILGEISNEFPCVAIAGTHGKTTTSSLLTFIVLTAGKNFASFVGGINENFNSNLVLNGSPEFVITEADEYDRSFLKLSPKYAILTSMDADHLDIYEDEKSMSDAFIDFANLVSEDGLLIVQNDLKNRISRPDTKTYGLNSEADNYLENIEFHSGLFHFDFIGPKTQIIDLKLGLPGYHNLENATAAIAMSLELGANPLDIKKALLDYKGVKRRFEYHIDNEELTYIDDYAHHPEEINAVVSSLRKMYPDRQITGIFQPHLFSRTRDLAEEFAISLSQLDEVILLDIYPAREVAIPGITSDWLSEKITIGNKTVCTKENLIELLSHTKPDILLSLGAGDIDQLVDPIKQLYSS